MYTTVRLQRQCAPQPRRAVGGGGGGEREAVLLPHPEVELRESISHRCHLFEVASAWDLAKETIHLPLGCLQSGTHTERPNLRSSDPRFTLPEIRIRICQPRNGSHSRPGSVHPRELVVPLPQSGGLTIPQFTDHTIEYDPSINGQLARRN